MATGEQNMSSTRRFAWPEIGLVLVAGGSALALLVANLGNTVNASEDWRYTTEVLNRSLPIVLGGTLFLLLLVASGIFGRHKLAIGFFYAAIALIILTKILPSYQTSSWQLQYFLSFSWGLAFFFLGVACFLLAKGNIFMEWGFCIIWSILIGLSFAEFFLLATPQAADGINESPAGSRHKPDDAIILRHSPWEVGICGGVLAATGKPYSFIHRSRKFDEVLFDVKYDINGWGHRQMPAPDSNAPNDLLLFGCSFTFGHGLESGETWAWQLAAMLGKTWQVENYAQNGYGANQMLCMLEHGLVIPPHGERRFALFLAIAHHVRRNEFFPNFPHYTLAEDASLRLEGKPRYSWLTRLGRTMNGSQLAASVSSIATKIILDRHPEFLRTYLAMILKSHLLLKERYNSQLVVLLWPDIEYLKPELEKAGIPVLLAREALPGWNADNGAAYMIHPLYERHPNSRAGYELAEWLAEWFKKQGGSGRDAHR